MDKDNHIVNVGAATKNQSNEVKSFLQQQKILRPKRFL